MFATLLSQQFNVVSCGETNKPKAVGQILNDFDGARPDGTGRAEKHDVLHQLVRICRRYRYMSGALNRRLSIKSRIPPMPGNQRPESLTWASRLKIDSIKSPTTA